LSSANLHPVILSRDVHRPFSVRGMSHVVVAGTVVGHVSKGNTRELGPMS
jgi:hypothetical protein